MAMWLSGSIPMRCAAKVSISLAMCKGNDFGFEVVRVNTLWNVINFISKCLLEKAVCELKPNFIRIHILLVFILNRTTILESGDRIRWFAKKKLITYNRIIGNIIHDFTGLLNTVILTVYSLHDFLMSLFFHCSTIVARMYRWPGSDSLNLLIYSSCRRLDLYKQDYQMSFTTSLLSVFVYIFKNLVRKYIFNNTTQNRHSL